MGIPHERVTTAMGFKGYRAVQHRGGVVRSRSMVGRLGASIEALFGDNITLYTERCEHARPGAFDLMLRRAAEARANAVIAMRHDASAVAPASPKGLAYGTAVVIEPAGR